MATPTVLLFDIDGTLLTCGGAGYRSMVGAFAALLGRADVFEGVSFAGMTDRAIARHGLTAAGTAATDEAIDRLLDAYLALLEAELGRARSFRVLPGVLELLAVLREVPEVAVGLGTGNVRRGAYAKLARGELEASFAFGGFGCDAEDRTEVLRAGALRGAERLDRRMEDCRVVVIGDTPKDIAAARGIGAVAVAVATGTYPLAALRAAGPDVAFGSLTEDGVEAALFGGPARPLHGDGA